MNEPESGLKDLGWGPAFQSQLTIDETNTAAPMRIIAVHRNGADALGASGARRLAAGDPPPEMLAVGDWVLVDGDGRIARLLDRKTLLQRRAAGTGRAVQLIAANLDTLFVVTSCNADFNVARLERYLALARAAGVMPVVVLTKADQCDDPGVYMRPASRLACGVMVEAVNALDPNDVARLLAWCGAGQTLALLGSSGVGKSTLINALTGGAQATQGVREDDARGRHTTTARSLHRMQSGAWLMDTPGMRELRLFDAAEGVEAVFEDIAALAAGCRFGDCAHGAEPGCAVRAAIAEGTLEAARLARWRKLAREEAHASAGLAEQRRRSRAFGRVARSATAAKQRERGD